MYEIILTTIELSRNKKDHNLEQKIPLSPPFAKGGISHFWTIPPFTKKG
jgi:hypothetical protein